MVRTWKRITKFQLVMRKIPNITRSPTDEFPRQALDSHPELWVPTRFWLFITANLTPSDFSQQCRSFVCHFWPIQTFTDILLPSLKQQVPWQTGSFGSVVIWRGHAPLYIVPKEPSLPSNCLLGDIRWKLSVLFVQIKAEGSSHLSHVTANSIFRGHHAKCHAVSRMELKV